MESRLGLNVVRITLDSPQYLAAVMQLVDKEDVGPSPLHLQNLLADDRTYLLAALIDGGVIGYALAYRFLSLYASTQMVYLYDIDVIEQHKRKGAGRMLVETVKDIAKRDGVTELWLGTGTDNKEGQGLFSATGGVKTGETFNDYTYYL